MENELDRFAREMKHGIRWLLTEVRRLRAENKRLLAENRELRQELTVSRLGEDTRSADRNREIDQNDERRPAELTPQAVQFYEGLPESLSFADYFHRADEDGISSEKAREYMLAFLREGMLRQRGRQLEKRPTFSPLAPRVESYRVSSELT